MEKHLWVYLCLRSRSKMSQLLYRMLVAFPRLCLDIHNDRLIDTFVTHVQYRCVYDSGRFAAPTKHSRRSSCLVNMAMNHEKRLNSLLEHIKEYRTSRTITSPCPIENLVSRTMCKQYVHVGRYFIIDRLVRFMQRCLLRYGVCKSSASEFWSPWTIISI